MKQTETTLHDLLTTLVNSMGYEFVGCELLKNGRSSLLRIYMDGEKGVTVDDCSKVSRQVSAMLDVEDPIQGPYTLEVSSPGIDRPLFEIAHFQKFVGSKVKVKINVPVEGRRNFVGVLLRVEGENIHILVDEQDVALPFSNIDKAKVIPDIVG